MFKESDNDELGNTHLLLSLFVLCLARIACVLILQEREELVRTVGSLGTSRKAVRVQATGHIAMIIQEWSGMWIWINRVHGP